MKRLIEKYFERPIKKNLPELKALFKKDMPRFITQYSNDTLLDLLQTSVIKYYSNFLLIFIQESGYKLS